MTNRSTKWDRQIISDTLDADAMGAPISNELLRHVANSLSRDDISADDWLRLYSAPNRRRISALILFPGFSGELMPFFGR